MSIDKITKTIELKVGDYVRTKKRGFQPSQIARIESISMKRDRCYHNQYYLELDHNLTPDYEFHIYEKDIEKSSPNIIDLIEVGDYVNGIQINDRIGDSVWHFSAYGDEDERLESKDIKTIVTHEQMKAMEYKIER